MVAHENYFPIYPVPTISLYYVFVNSGLICAFRAGHISLYSHGVSLGILTHSGLPTEEIVRLIRTFGATDLGSVAMFALSWRCSLSTLN